MQHFPWTALGISSALLKRQPLFLLPLSTLPLVPPLDNPQAGDEANTALPDGIWLGMADRLFTVSGLSGGGGGGEKRGGGVAEGVGLGLESESESWGD